MPLFEYGCAACGRRFEQLLSSRDLMAEILCPFCGSEDVSKLLSTFSTPSRVASAAADPAASSALPMPQSDHCGLDWRSEHKPPSA